MQTHPAPRSHDALHAAYIGTAPAAWVRWNAQNFSFAYAFATAHSIAQCFFS
jgi:hypothetical protein